MPNANTIFGIFEKLGSADIKVNQQRCVVARHKNATCMRCVEACTSECITYDPDEGVVVYPQNCIGCGTCATVCPTCAIEICSPTDEELQDACLAVAEAADGVVTIACQNFLNAAEGHYDPAKVIGVTCLGRIEESLLMTLAAAGVQKVVLVEAECDSCEHSNGRKTIELVCENARALLDLWGNAMELAIVSKLPSSTKRTAEEAYDVSKRQFFSSVRDETKNAASIAAEVALKDTLQIEDTPAKPRYAKCDKDGTLPHYVPERRNQLLSALRTMGEPADVMIDTRLWGNVIIDTEACNTCLMCSKFCPTGALVKFEDEDGTMGVSHSPSLCVKCRCCEDICPKDAISLSEEVFAVDLLEGETERFVMTPPKVKPGPHQMWHTMRDLLGCDQIYER